MPTINTALFPEYIFYAEQSMSPALQPIGYQALRKGRVSVPGQAYLVTTVCHLRTPYFLNTEAARSAASVLRSDEAWPHAAAEAWVLMPDHWHGLVILEGSESISRVIQRLKSILTRQVADGKQQRHTLWQRGFRDRALRSEDSLLRAARYVLDNPVRAGLVNHWSVWPHRGGRLIDAIQPNDPAFL
ncbi:MAG: transposase [Aquimonas sp.]|nr:transposase [Aquimonas sp.]